MTGWTNFGEKTSLLSHVPFPGAFDGALWTLYNEFLCYLFVVALGILAILRRAPALILAIAPILLVLLAHTYRLFVFPFSIFYVGMFHGVDAYIAQAAYFFVGAAVYLYRNRVRLHVNLFVVMCALTALAAPTKLARYVLPFAFSYVLPWLAFRLPFHNAARFGDFSYGLYIYAFPVQQLLALVGIPHWGFWGYLLLSVTATLPLAFLSWHVVERRCLGLKHAKIQVRAPSGRISLALYVPRKNAH